MGAWENRHPENDDAANAAIALALQFGDYLLNGAVSGLNAFDSRPAAAELGVGLALCALFEAGLRHPEWQQAVVRTLNSVTYGWQDTAALDYEAVIDLVPRRFPVALTVEPEANDAD